MEVFFINAHGFFKAGPCLRFVNELGNNAAFQLYNRYYPPKSVREKNHA